MPQIFESNGVFLFASLNEECLNDVLIGQPERMQSRATAEILETDRRSSNSILDHMQYAQ
jgi:hypothetical protein